MDLFVRVMSGFMSVISFLFSSLAPATESSNVLKEKPQTVNIKEYILAEEVYPDYPVYADTDTSELDDYEFNSIPIRDSYHSELVEFRNKGVTEEDIGAFNEFSLKTSRTLYNNSDGFNFIYSPISLWTGLAVLEQCTDELGSEQIKTLLSLNQSKAISDRLDRVWHSIYTKEPNASCLLSNSIWLNNINTGAYYQTVIDILSQDYKTGSYLVPMGVKSTDDSINEWVYNHTNGLIVGGIETKEETLAELLSTVYYKASWVNQFSEDLTKEDVFHGGTDQIVPFMKQVCRGDTFAETEDYVTSTLECNTGEVTFILPKGNNTPETILNSIDIFSIDSEETQGTVHWRVPKFDIADELDLMDSLKSLGLSNLGSLESLTSAESELTSAKQLTHVRMGEEGIEASAMTAFSFDTTSMITDELPECYMTLDRPFIFIVRVNNVPLFVGIIKDII